MLRVICFALAMLGLSIAVASAQTADSGNLRGQVSDAASPLYLDGATVEVLGTSYRATADRFGRYEIRNIPAGTYEVRARYVGYESSVASVTVGSGETVEQSFALGGEIYELEDFEVRGRETATARALARERSSQVTTDIVASDAFGNLPDQTIADAVRRLPGVNVEKDSQGRSGRYVTIRGMNSDFNSVNVNGQNIMVGNFDGASRSVPLDVVPANAAESIEVKKMQLPSDDAAGIGGSITIRTRSAFDVADSYAQIEASVGYNELADDYSGGYPHDDLPYEFSAAYSTYLNKAKTIGLAASVSYSEQSYLFQSVENFAYDRFLAVDPIDLDLDENLDPLPEGERLAFEDKSQLYQNTSTLGEVILIPRGAWNDYLDRAYMTTGGRVEEAFDTVETIGGTLRFDFRPNDQFELAVSSSFNERDSNQGSQRLDTRYDGEFFSFDVPDPIVDGENIVEFWSEDRIARRVRDFHETQTLFTLLVEATHTLDDWQIDYGAGYDRGEFEGGEDDTSALFRTGFGDNFYSQIDRDPYNPDYGSRGYEATPDRFQFDDMERGTRIIDDDSLSGFLNVRRNLEIAGIPGFLKAGGKVVARERDFEDIRIRYRDLFDGDWYLDGAFIGDEQIYGSSVADYNVDQTLGGNPFGFMIDPIRVRESEAAWLARGQADEGDPYWYLYRNEARDMRQELVNSYDATEDIYAGYVEYQMQWDRLTAIVGVRVEHTEVQFDTHAGDFFETDPQSPLFVRPIMEENDYTDVFPHLHLRFDQNDNIVWRASINRSIARPSYFQLNPAVDIDPSANDGDGSIVLGDTQLDPVLSTNIDLGIDYFFAGTGRLSFGVFYKDMSNNVYRLNRTTIPGLDPDYFIEGAGVREFRNADGATVAGIELGFDVPLVMLTDALVGLSIFGNYTWVDSEVDGIQRYDEEYNLIVESGESPLFGQVPNTFNVGVRYERFGFDVQLAYNWNDEYLDFNGIQLDKTLDVYIAERDSLDLSVRYSFLEHWQVFYEWENILGGEAKAFQGDESRMYYREETGWTMWAGIRWNM